MSIKATNAQQIADRASKLYDKMRLLSMICLRLVKAWTKRRITIVRQ
ncbi:hypothetical protein NIY95_23125 [Escherichia albertii]|nr:hypothetical protein [Escherichia albertii]UUL23451.1 hypothetical protein NIY95_23125 [Escherichia albertii]